MGNFNSISIVTIWDNLVKNIPRIFSVSKNIFCQNLSKKMFYVYYFFKTIFKILFLKKLYNFPVDLSGKEARDLL